MTAAVKEAKEEEEKAYREAREILKKQFGLTLVSAILRPVTNLFENAMLESNSVGIISKLVGGLGGRSEKKSDDDMGKLSDILLSARRDLENKKGELAARKKDLDAEKNPETKPQIEREITRLKEEVASKEETLHRQEEGIGKANELLGSHAEAARKKEDCAIQLRNRLRDELMRSNVELARSVRGLKLGKKQEDDLETAMHALEIARRAMGRAKVVFENVCTFWDGVQSQCKKLTNVSTVQSSADLEERGVEGEFMTALGYSWVRWVALGRVNHIAEGAIGKVEVKYNEMMKNLPIKEEAGAIIESLTKDLAFALEEEQRLLKAAASQEESF